ncbi:MAG: RadC family protein, partial [Flavobacteriales bacterium]
LSEYCCQSLLQIPRITPMAALRIKAAFELTKRLSCAKLETHQSVVKSHDAFQLLLPNMFGLRHEEFWVIGLNQRHRIIHHACVSLGGLAYTLVDPKRVFRLALEMNAVKIIVAHNHPSGNLQPSEDDIRMTIKLREAGRNIECHVLDHLIITDHGYYSFADEGKMNA